MASTEEKLSTLRLKNFEDSVFFPNNQKFGLFSFAGTLSINKNPYFTATPSHKNAEGKVPTNPPNILISSPKSGKGKDALFSSFEYQIDRYRDPVSPNRSEKERIDKLKKFHEVIWKPATLFKEKVALFNHEPCERHAQIKRRLSDGGVKFEPINFLTSPPKKGNAGATPKILIGTYPEYMTDEYERKFKYEKEIAKKNKAKGKGKPFKTVDFGNKTFNDDKSIYGGAFTSKEFINTRAMSVSLNYRPFYPTSPCNKTYTIGKYPPHLPEPFCPKKKQKYSECPPWKATFIKKSKPTASILSNIKNIRNEFPLVKKLV